MGPWRDRLELVIQKVATGSFREVDVHRVVRRHATKPIVFTNLNLSGILSIILDKYLRI